MTFGHDFWSRFCVRFWKALFSALGRLLGTQGVQQGPQMEPEWSQNGACRRLVGSVKTMVFIVREAHGAVSGMLWEATWFGLGLGTLLGGVLGRVFADLGSFWVPIGLPGGSILE